MDKICLLFHIVFCLNVTIAGRRVKELTVCRGGSRHQACECEEKDLANPPNGRIQFVDKTKGIYKCNSGYTLNVYAIIRCLFGERHKSNFWNISSNPCSAIVSESTSGEVTLNTVDDDLKQNSTDNIRKDGPSPLETENTTNSTPAEEGASSLIVTIILSVSLAAAVFALVLFRIKYKKGKRSARTITNKCYDLHKNQLYMQPEETQDGEYADIQVENTEVGEMSSNVYQTIDTLQDDNDRDISYGHLNTVANLRVNQNYSHISVSSTNKNPLNDLTYSHTNHIIQSPIDKQEQLALIDNDSYNRLTSVARCKDICTSMIENKTLKTEYDHAKPASQRHITERDTYSHLQ